MAADGCKGMSPAVAVGWVFGGAERKLAGCTVVQPQWERAGQLLQRLNAELPVTQQFYSQGDTHKSQGIHAETCPPVLTAAACTIAQK